MAGNPNKMGSGKSAEQSKINVYYGTIAGSLGCGPGYSLEYIICNGKLFQFSIMRGQSVVDWAAANPTLPISEFVASHADYIDARLDGYGDFRLYWGTETQVEDPTLSVFEDQPGFRGQVYVVL